MTKTMTLKEISNRVIQLSMSTCSQTDTKTIDGVTVLRTSGQLDNNRPATVRVVQRDEMLSVGLLVPGMGDMSISFQLFADEATEERIERYLNHYLGIHKNAKAEWDSNHKA